MIKMCLWLGQIFCANGATNLFRCIPPLWVFNVYLLYLSNHVSTFMYTFSFHLFFFSIHTTKYLTIIERQADK